MLGKLGGRARKYRLGELARYKIVNVLWRLRTYDVNTRTVEGKPFLCPFRRVKNCTCAYSDMILL